MTITCLVLMSVFVVSKNTLRRKRHVVGVPASMPATAPALVGPKLVAMMPSLPGFYDLQFKMRVGTQYVFRDVTMRCRIFIPRDYDKNKSAYPLLLYLHGEEAQGKDLVAIAKLGPERRIREDQGFRDNFKSIYIAPLCPPDETWDDSEMAQALLALVEDLSKEFRVDPEQVSIAGTGVGMAGAWRVAAASPERFASVLGSAPRGSALGGEDPAKLRHLYTYVAASQNDKPGHDIYLATVDALGKAKAEVQFRVAGNNANECSQWFYQDNTSWEWLRNHKRRTQKERIERDLRDAKELAEAIASLPSLPGQYKLKFATWAGDKKIEMPYQLSLPRGYDGKTRWPCIVFLSGAGEQNPDLSAINSHGPCAKMRDDPAFKEWCPFIVISPTHDNSPERAIAICELVDQLEKNTKIDPDRVYVTGLSLGGTTTWTVGTTAPDKFAAIVPINGRDRCWEVASEKLRYLTTWIIVGGADGDFYTGSVHMHKVLAATGNDVHLTVIPGEGHGSWPRYYNDRRFYDWLLQHKRLSPVERDLRAKYPTTMPSKMLADLDRHPELQRPGQHRLEFATQMNGKPYLMRYALSIPKGYESGNERWPMVLYLHNDEHRMTDQSMIFEYGSGVDIRKDEKSRTAFPMIGLIPQLPENRQWAEPEIIKMTLALMDEVSKKIRVDADRIYATGVQSGGGGVWHLALQAPDRFAAIFPYQSSVIRPEEVTKKLLQVPLRAIAPQEDGGAVAAAKQIVELVQKAKGDAMVSVISQKADANQWQPYYTDPELVKWLLKYKRPASQARN